jgi:hypothetical protein
MDGSFYSTSKGPTCPGCALGKPPKAKVWPKPEEAMNNPQLAAVLDDASPLAAPQPEKVVAEAKAAAENAPVQLIMTLALDFSMAESQYLDNPEKFMRDVAEDLASASGLQPANFRIKDVSPGSIIILDIEVVPDPLAPAAHLLAATDFAEQAVDPSSTLRSGKITSYAIGVKVVAQERKVEALDEVRNVGNGTDAEVFSPAAKTEVERGSDRGREGEREYNTCCIPGLCTCVCRHHYISVCFKILFWYGSCVRVVYTLSLLRK